MSAIHARVLRAIEDTFFARADMPAIELAACLSRPFPLPGEGAETTATLFASPKWCYPSILDDTNYFMGIYETMPHLNALCLAETAPLQQMVRRTTYWSHLGYAMGKLTQ